MDGNETLVETDDLSSCYFHRHSTAAAAAAAVADELAQTNWQPMMNSVCLEILRSHHLILDETHSFRHPCSSSKILCCCYAAAAAAAAAADGSLEIEPRHRRSQPPPPPPPLLPPLERYRVGLIHEPRSPPENQIRHASEPSKQATNYIEATYYTEHMDVLACCKS